MCAPSVPSTKGIGMQYIIDVTKAWPGTVSKVVTRVTMCLPVGDTVVVLAEAEQRQEQLDQRVRWIIVPAIRDVPGQVLELVMEAVNAGERVTVLTFNTEVIASAAGLPREIQHRAQ